MTPISGEIVVFAASSLADAFQDMATAFQQANRGVKFVTAQPSVPIGQYTAQMLDKASADPAAYPIAVAKGNNTAGGEAFVGYVLGSQGQATLAKWGFLPPTQTPAAAAQPSPRSNTYGWLPTD